MHRVLLLPLSFPSLATCLRNLWPFTVGRTDRLKPSAPCLRASDHSTRPAAKPRGNCMDYWFQSGCGAAPRLRTIGSALRGPQGRRWRSLVSAKMDVAGRRSVPPVQPANASCAAMANIMAATPRSIRRQVSGRASQGASQAPPRASVRNQRSTRWPRRACKRPVPVAARRACRSAPRYPDRHVG